jgi:hypothetical protein
MKKSSLITGGIVSVAVLVAVNAFAQVGDESAAQIQNDANDTGITYGSYYNGNYPVITAVLCQGGTSLNGLSYSVKDTAFLAYDGSASLEWFGLAEPTNTPSLLAVGKGVGITSGVYSPYEGLPEVGTNAYTSITVYPSSAANAVPAPVTTTIATLNTDVSLTNANGTLPTSVAGNLLILNNVTISGITNVGETFTTHNITLTATDGSGSCALYYYVTDDELANQNLFGTAIPTGPVTIEGLETVFDGTAEVDLLAVVPEPGTLTICGAGAVVLALFAFRSRKTKIV